MYIEKVEKYRSVLKQYIKPDSKIISMAIIEGENDIAYSSGEWDISKDLEIIDSAWQKMDAREIVLDQVKYAKVQCTPEVLIAITPDRKGSFVGFKDKERKIICKITPDKAPRNQITQIPSIAIGLAEASKALRKLSSKRPYMDLEAPLGKVEQLKWATPRILLDDTNNLQELGLLKFGLSIEEAKVYLALLEKGREGAKVGELNEELSIKRTTIYRIVDRLIEKDWVVRLPSMPKIVQEFVARPLNDIFDERIQQKEEELKVLKSFRFVMGDTLENGWIPLQHSEIDKESEQKDFDFNILGITGVEKDCGLYIFEYGKPIDNDIVIRAALQLSCEKLKIALQIDEDIEEYKNADLKEVDFRDTKLQEYLGATMYLKFKDGSKTANNIGTDWIVAAKQVAIPIEDKIYVIWSSEEKFPILFSIILKLS